MDQKYKIRRGLLILNYLIELHKLLKRNFDLAVTCYVKHLNALNNFFTNIISCIFLKPIGAGALFSEGNFFMKKGVGVPKFKLLENQQKKIFTVFWGDPECTL